MLPLSSRALSGGPTEPLQTRSLVLGMVLALLCAGVGYAARGETDGALSTAAG
ncbi:MAG: hypothetical protein JWN57_413, partial [Frankiales bacterium]|nr:hypothetical protein [Frankiales bacterium]